MSKILCLSLVLLGLSFLELSVLVADTTFEVRSAAFIPTKKRFRNIYGNVGSCFGLEASTDFWSCSDLWGNLDQFNKRGHLKGCGDSKVRLFTLSFGIKKVYSFNCYLKGYLGLGISFANIRIKNTQDDLRNHSNKTSVGGVIKSGFYIPLKENIFLDLFADYYYQPVHYYYSTDCGGVRLGGGLGLVY